MKLDEEKTRKIHQKEGEVKRNVKQLQVDLDNPTSVFDEANTKLLDGIKEKIPQDFCCSGATRSGLDKSRY